MEGKEILLQLALIYIFARVGGYISQKFHQPVVLGEMLMGIIIGPSVLALFHMNEILHVFSDLGVILLMFIAGLETNVSELRASAKSFTVIALGGVLVPFALGYAVCFMFGVREFSEAAFIGLILTATSVSITVQTLRELKQLRSKQGVGILGAAIIDDVIGIIMLALLLGMVTGNSSIGTTIMNITVYFGVVFVFGFLFQKIVNNYGYTLNLSGSMTIIGLIICLVLAYFAEKAEIAAITGAYLAGVILSTTSYKTKISSQIEVAAYLIFTPIFFVGIGMSAEIKNIGAPILIFAIAVFLAAVLGKIIGCGLGAKLMGFNRKRSMQIGIGMASRGEVALIVASVGLKQGIIEARLFTMMVLVIVLTSLITPALLKVAFKGEPAADSLFPEDDEEGEEHEKLAGSNGKA
ncbi:MAG: cation:proton antiporter [Clostridia bacterium]